MSVLNKNVSLSAGSDKVVHVCPSKSRTPYLTVANPFGWLEPYLPILERHGMRVHLFEPCDSRSGHHVDIDGRTRLSFSSYNYLGFSGDPLVSAAAKAAIDRFGTSASASRIVAGELAIHQELEREIAGLIGADDCLVYASGHATNVTTLGCLFDRTDLILYDSLCHNSIQQGIRLSGATSYKFSHNNSEHLDSLLRRRRSQFRSAIIITEGVFSMDGDIAPMPELIDVKRRHDAFLMVDEAHSMGVIGPRGRGIADHFALGADDVDIWMGTLSKALASCGGYVAGKREMVESLRYAAPGFIYSCGISPPNTASALAAVRLLRQEPGRVRKLADNVKSFKTLAQQGGLNTGLSNGSAVVPIILGCSLTCLIASHLLHEAGILVHPGCYPAVPLNAARLRFFLTSLHSAAEIEATVKTTLEVVARARKLASSELMRSTELAGEATAEAR